MPKEWTPEEREAAGKWLKEGRARKQQLKQTEQVQVLTVHDQEVLRELQPKLPPLPDLHDLLRWVARSIVTINMAGKKMDTKCLLCQVSRLHREPCRHDQIWALAGK